MKVIPLGCDTKKDVLLCIVKNVWPESSQKNIWDQTEEHLQNNQLVFKKKKKIKMKKQKRLKDIKDNIGSTDNTRISMVDQTIKLTE